jgi:TolB-like protein
MKPAWVVLILLLLLLPSAALSEPPKIGLVPFENLSGTRVAAGQVMPVIEKIVAKKGFTLIKGKPMENFLEGERIRFLDAMPTVDMKKLASYFELDALLTGAILFYKPGANPQVGITARLISKDGSLLWGNSVGLTGEDMAGVLGLGKVEMIQELVPVAVGRLFESFHAPGGVEYKTLWRIPVFISPYKPFAYLSPKFRTDRQDRIAILPLGNQSGIKEAGRILLKLLTLRLSGSGRFKVVEAGDLRESMIEEGIRLVEGIDLARLKALKERLGVRLFVGGTIYKYSEGRGVGGLSSPELELLLSITDAETGEIVWTSHHTRKGEDYLTFFQFGQIRSPIALSDQVLEEMVETLVGKSP